MHLILVDQPSETLVSGIPGYNYEDSMPPDWNIILDGDIAMWYKWLFAFAELYLDDDGGWLF